jgi:competence protein ComGA
MKEKFEQLLHMVERKRATDVHFTLMQHRLHVQVRGWNGLETVQNAAFDEGLFCYLKYISNLDLGNTLQPQSGNFQYEFRQELLYFRFSLLPTLEKQTAVLRVLNNHKEISLEDLRQQADSQLSELDENKKRTHRIERSHRQRENDNPARDIEADCSREQTACRIAGGPY